MKHFNFSSFSICMRTTQLDFDGKPKGRYWLRILFFVAKQLPPELPHQVLHSHHCFCPCKFISRAHILGPPPNGTNTATYLSTRRVLVLGGNTRQVWVPRPVQPERY
ncbi:hypothetical protein GQ55_8G084500 [Panicum hallii var. hallii]|uniref:Uncharacterized protein n=1 Tax=Panicum hallii var. hallii TaxID=1504633 RepID=A0A2T7CM28_9POAL|nr:hypothetical protein GQ55_8G084500 [Panicum hallii var. hallii]